MREDAQYLETEGLRKIESAVAGLEAEGLYGLLRGAVSHFPISSVPLPPQKCHHTPTATISKPPPQEPEEDAPEVPASVVREVELALEAPSSAVSQGLGVAIPAHMTPVHLQFGASRGSTSARWRGAVRAINLTGHNLHICAQGPLGSEVGMSFLCQDIPKLRHPQASQEISQFLIICTLYIYSSSAKLIVSIQC